MNKIARKTRGRPREFDHDQVLEKAMRLFWSQGLAGTSLDQLAAAMNMNRPSLYNAFGGKKSIYRRALARFVAKMKAEAGALLLDEPDLKRALGKFFAGALSVYCGPDVQLGCFVMCTAATEATSHPEVQADLKHTIAELDGILSQRFTMAQLAGQFPVAADAAAAARMTQAILHSLALRARAGESKTALKKMAGYAVAVITAPAKSRP